MGLSSFAMGIEAVCCSPQSGSSRPPNPRQPFLVPGRFAAKEASSFAGFGSISSDFLGWRWFSFFIRGP